MQNTDGSLLFDTAIDNSGFNNGINNLNIIADNAIANIASNMIGNISNAAAQIPQQMVAVGSNFEASMSQVAATMGITAATEEYKKLSAAAKEMGETTKFSASQAGEALNYLALAGYDTNKSIAALPTILNTAAAGGMELAAASDMITDAMSALGLETSQMSDFSDKLAVTAQKSNTSVAQLGEAILTVGGTAKSLSGGVTEMNTVLGILADNGIKGAEGGTALRNVILSLTAPTSTAADAISALGLTVYDNSGKLRSLQDILADLSAELATMSDADKNQALSDIFNKVDLKSVNALLGTSAERFGELTGYINDCSGAAARMAETMDNNLKGDITILQSGLEGLGIAAYEKFATPMRTAVKSVTDSISNLTSNLKNGALSGSFDSISNGFAKITEAATTFIADNVLPAVIEALAWIVDNGDSIVATLTGIGAGFAAFKAAEAISGVISALQKFKLANEAASIAQAALNAAMEINPAIAIASAIGLVTAAITALVIGYNKANPMAQELNEKFIETTSTINDTKSELQDVQDKIDTIEAKGPLTIIEQEQLDKLRETKSELQTQIDELNTLSEIQRIEAEKTAADEFSNAGKEIENNKDLVYSYQLAKEQLEDLRRKEKEFNDKGINRWSNNLEFFELEESIQAVSGSVEGYKSELSDFYSKVSGWNDIINANGVQSQELLDDTKYFAEVLGIETDKIDNTVPDLSWAEQIAENEKNKWHSGVGAAEKVYSTEASELAAAQESATAALKEGWKQADHAYATGDIATEQALYAEKLRIWNEYGDASLEDHWTYYEDLAKYRKDNADNAAEAEKAAMDNEWKSIANAENLGLMSAEEAYKKRLEFIQKYCPEYSDEWAAYYQDVYNYQQNEADKSLELQRDSLTNQADELKDGLNNILSTYKSAFSDLEAMKSSYKNKLLSVGDAFSVTENADGSKTAKVNDLRKQMSEMKKYHAYIKKLKAEGVSSGLLQELVSMDWDEGMVFAEQLSAMSSADFGEINGYYNERDKLAQSLAEELYAPETAQLNTNLQTDIMTQYQALPPALQVTGAEAYNAFITGMQTAAGNVSFDVDKLINTLDTQLTTAISNMDLSDCIAALSESSDAYSAGKTMGDNFVSGFKDVFDDMIATAFGEQTKLAAELSINNKSTSDKTNGAEKIVIENNIHTDVNLDGKKVTETVNKTNNIIDREKGK